MPKSHEDLRIHRKTFVKRSLLSVLVLATLLAVMFLVEFLLYVTTGFVPGAKAKEAEIQEFWDMKPSVQAEKTKALCTVDDAADVDDQMSLVWNLCEKEGVKDYDKNGVVNCCDRATAFCIKWKKSYRNDIRLCQQQTNVLNHMYVQIYLPDYGWWSVDPTFTENGTHDMQAVWGWRYNPAQNVAEAYWVRVFSKHIR